MTLHDFFALHILPNRNIGVQYIRYTNEYIPKLQIHQHSLLTRKVFSRHNLSAQVFFSVSYRSSSSHLHHWIIIKSGSLLDLEHHWIIIKSGSSLDLEHHWIIINSKSSLDLDRRQIIITGAISTILVIGSSTNPSLFHVGCRPRFHVGLHRLQHLYLTME